MKYTVTLHPSGDQFICEDQSTILDAAIKANIHLSHSCRDGSCGTCKSKLLKGKVDQTADVVGISRQEFSDGYILTCKSRPLSDIVISAAYYSELDGIEPGIYPCKVQSIEFPARNILILKLRMPPDMDMHYLAGQYVELMWKGMQRSYSIANSPRAGQGIELHIRRVDGGVFSSLLFEELKTEALMRLYGPHGTFFVRDTGAPIIFLAGGTGFAPVKSMVESLLEDKTDRLIHIYWGVRTEEDFYTDVPAVWGANKSNVVYTPVLSADIPDWSGRRGLVHRAVLEDFNDLSSYEVYASGSQEMITAAKSDFLANRLLEQNFFSDAFTPYKQKN